MRLLRITPTREAHLVRPDSNFHEDTPLESMTPEYLDAHAYCPDMSVVSFTDDSSFYQPSFDALSYDWGTQDSFNDNQDSRASEFKGDGVLNDWVGPHSHQPWYPGSYFVRSIQSAAMLAWPRVTESSRKINPWDNEYGDAGSKRWEESSATDLPPVAEAAFCDSKPDSSTALVCSTCRSVFTGRYRRGNLSRHFRTKHNTHRHVGRNRHQTLAYAVFLTGAQLACTIPLHSYDHCHSDPACRPPIASSSILKEVPPYLDFLIRPSTNVFVFSALAYSAVAMHQYRINDRDRFQQLCLVVGVVTGFVLSVASPAGLNVQRVSSSAIAMAITTALLVSALGHWTYAMLHRENTRKEVVTDEKKVGGAVASLRCCLQDSGSL